MERELGDLIEEGVEAEKVAAEGLEAEKVVVYLDLIEPSHHKPDDP